MDASSAKLFASRRTVLTDGVKPAVILVQNGKIEAIYPCANDSEISERLQTFSFVDVKYDFGNLVLMPGLVDSHVHVNEPGRSEWEGFWTATKAAAAGGVTTIVDMPLNSIPPTTTLENLKIKAQVARTKAFVDIGFWGGVIPGNQKDLKPLVEAGVVGFKCFLCDSCIEEFPHVNEDDVKKALSELKNLNTVLAFHAECELEEVIAKKSNENPSMYSTYLKTRPEMMEVEAITMVSKLCKDYSVRCHIVHLSAAEALRLVKEAKQNRVKLTAETCYHYLHLSAEKIPPNATQFKCCPPIRDENNREKLWSALKDGTLDMVVSDHSPCIAELKQGSDFLSAWGGISSVQFGLSVLWTEARNRGLDYHDVARLVCSAPAELCGLGERKGKLKVGMDADFVVWDPDTTVQIEESAILHKNKLTPYLGEKLYGKVLATVVRGNVIYEDGVFSKEPLGQLLLKNDFLSTI